MRLDLEHWLPDDVLAKADRAGMLASLEIRTPFLHRELVELAMTLPSAVHLKQGGKALLRKVLADVAPEAAWSRSKTAFRVPAAEWLRGGLGDVLAQQTDGGGLYADGWFDGPAVRAAIDEHRRGTVNRTSVLWPMLALGTWYEANRGALGG
jgi:asparagine synthase (glutamine-hydrolysing)